MNTTFKQLLTNVYELEGLLLVMQRHMGDTPQLVIDRFKEKANEMAATASLLESLKNDEEEPASQTVPPVFVPPVQPDDDSEPVASPLPQEPEPVVETIIEPEPKLDSKPEPEPKSEPVAETTHIESVKVSVAPKESPTRDITSAFSINDRFLFQRELFDGNKEKFDDTIALMQRQPNIEKIKEFMTNVLQWDTNDEVVKEFIRLVELSFKEN